MDSAIAGAVTAREAMMTIRRGARLCAVLLGALAVGLGASSCTGSGSDESSASMEEVQSGEPAAGPAEAGSADTGTRAEIDTDVVATGSGAGVTRLVRTAEISVAVEDVDAAASTVRTVAVALGGLVSSERTGVIEGGSAAPDQDVDGSPSPGRQAVIEMRVPEPKLDDALRRVAATGREQTRSTTSEDVTATLADLDSRVATQVRSVTRVRELLNRASSLKDVVLLESELARRESDLEAVQARQRALTDRATLATMTVTLSRTGEATPAEPAQAGFLSGLQGGWDALRGTTAVLLTILGAVLPIGIAVLVIGWPASLIYRWLRRDRASASGSQPAQQPPATPSTS